VLDTPTPRGARLHVVDPLRRATTSRRDGDRAGRKAI
jgi:hypothetical protein